ncbi:MAG: Na+-transporting NADH:ubiquinone oxidoreductase subunit NqrC [Paraglaciecola sp.]|jgi:Na+-transporting NADH:ubiquinone oxidoreductase subunit NqrC
MKTIYTTIAILAIALFSQTAVAKLGLDHSQVQLQNKIEVNIEEAIVDNITNMLSTIQAPTIETYVAKQLNIGLIQLQTNALIQNVNKTLPAFKFKVVIAD